MTDYLRRVHLVLTYLYVDVILLLYFCSLYLEILFLALHLGLGGLARYELLALSLHVLFKACAAGLLM